jgi:Flp pilus assembly protein TadD
MPAPRALAPDEPQALYNWATCLTALGRLETAEQLLDRVIALAPDDHDAYYNRSTLRRQTAERNHVRELATPHQLRRRREESHWAMPLPRNWRICGVTPNLSPR